MQGNPGHTSEGFPKSPRPARKPGGSEASSFTESGKGSSSQALQSNALLLTPVLSSAEHGEFCSSRLLNPYGSQGCSPPAERKGRPLSEVSAHTPGGELCHARGPAFLPGSVESLAASWPSCCGEGEAFGGSKPVSGRSLSLSLCCSNA